MEGVEVLDELLSYSARPTRLCRSAHFWSYASRYPASTCMPELMKRLTRRFPFTVIAMVLAVLILLATELGDVHLLAIPWLALARFEQNDVDAVFSAFVLLLIALITDEIRAAKRSHRAEWLQTERLRVLQATIRTVQDIVNNSLNQLQLVRFEAEGHVSEESLTLFDEAIHDTADKLTRLGDLQTYTEHEMAVGTGVGVSS